MAAPVLTYAGSSLINWVWPDANPDHWIIESSATGTGGWSVYGTCAGNIRTLSAFGGPLYYRVTGYDAGGLAITFASNGVYHP
jgi:hypothetical protein